MKRIPLLLGLALLLIAFVYWTGSRENGTAGIEVGRDSHVGPTPSLSSRLESELQPTQPLDQPLPQPGSGRLGVPEHVEPGPCRIDGTVVRQAHGVDTAIADVEVLLGEDWNPGEFAPLPGQTRREYQVLSRTRSDATGAFTFDGISGNLGGRSNAQYRILARLADGMERSALVQVSDKYPRRAPTLVFGSACIRGTLFGVDGRPIERARVRLETSDNLVDGHEIAWQATDATGKYSFEALRAGRYAVLVIAPNEQSPMSAWPGRRYIIQIREGEDAILDAGSPSGAPYLRGMVFSSSGHQLTRLMSIGLTSTVPLPLGGEVVTMVSCQFEGEHGFEVPLEPGDWTPRLSWSEPSPMTGAGWRSREPVHVPREGLTQNLIAGHRLEGRILVAGTDQCLKDSTPGTLYVHLKPVATSTSERMTPVDEHGSFAFEMLEEGEWFATVPPLKFAAAEEGVNVTIASSDRVRTLDLVVRQP